MNDVATLRSAKLLASKAFSPKALHIRIYPTPVDVAERKAILNVLRGYGEVDTFRNMKWEYRNPAPNTCLAVFREGASAQRLIGDSPLRFTLEPVEEEQSQEPSNPYFDLFTKLEAQSKSRQGTASTSRLAPPSESEMATDDMNSDSTNGQTSSIQGELFLQPSSNAQSSKRERTFLVHASPWTSNLTAIIERAPHSGSYPIDTKSLSHQDLARRVPLPGLSVVDFSTKPLPMRIVEKRRAALASRKTLRQIMQEKDEQQEDSTADDAVENLAPESAAMSTHVPNGHGGYIDRQEAGRRAVGKFTGSGDSAWDSSTRGDGGNSAPPGHLRHQGQRAFRGTKDGYERARRRNPNPWSRKYDRMI